jgi:hypothetical protein
MTAGRGLYGGCLQRMSRGLSLAKAVCPIIKSVRFEHAAWLMNHFFMVAKEEENPHETL